MRAVKFRVYVEKTGEMLTWDKLQRIKQFALDDGIKPKEVILLPVNEGTHLMQWTGISDKNNVDIYEGDIVRIYDDDRHIETIAWDDRRTGFSGDHFPASKEMLEVIGNIHEKQKEE